MHSFLPEVPEPFWLAVRCLSDRSKGVERPPLAPLIPTAKGVSLLIDCGANVDARPSHLVQFAKMGSIYMENVVGYQESACRYRK